MAAPFCIDVETSELEGTVNFPRAVSVCEAAVESDSIKDFATIMSVTSELKSNSKNAAGKINLEQDNVKNGLGQLVLTLVRLLHELLERQAIRRIEAGSLSNSEIENIGVTLMRQAEEIDRLRKEFGLEKKDLNLDLGPLGKLL
ncbi:MAG: gas vesicle protein K [Desulfomonilaceae bacterium]|jgi:hypothetical protein